MLHEIPQELSDFAVLLHAGLSVRRALWLDFLSASVAMVGMGLTLLLGAVVALQVTEVLLPIAAGGFVYIAAADLMPELRRERKLSEIGFQTALIAVGIGVMAAFGWLECVATRAPAFRASRLQGTVVEKSSSRVHSLLACESANRLATARGRCDCRGRTPTNIEKLEAERCQSQPAQRLRCMLCRAQNLRVLT
jgi:hypothetical protein